MNADTEQMDMREHLVSQADKLFEKLPMLGPVVWLLSQAPSHRHLFLTDLEWRVLPPVTLGQCKLYMKDKAPLAYVSWAKTSDEVAHRISQGNVRLAPVEWANGENIWIIDVIAPFGGVAELLKDLGENVFKGQQISYLAPNESGNGFVVRHL